jgi:hypothetical protein
MQTKRPDLHTLCLFFFLAFFFFFWHAACFPSIRRAILPGTLPASPAYGVPSSAGSTWHAPCFTAYGVPAFPRQAVFLVAHFHRSFQWAPWVKTGVSTGRTRPAGTVGGAGGGGEAVALGGTFPACALRSTCGILSVMKILDIPRSGSWQAVTSSRNRYGQYVRVRATPVNPKSSYQGIVRARLSVNAAAWRALTDLQRAGWASLAGQMSRSDALGQNYTLNGFGAYCSVNNNQLAAGNAVLPDAPGFKSPSTLTTVTVTLTVAAFSVAFTPTPLAAGQRWMAYCSPQRAAGRAYEANFKLIAVGAAASATPAVLTTAYAARCGTPVVGQRVFMSFHVYDAGFRSGPLNVSQVVA